MEAIKVGLIGATGMTGSSILNGLIESSPNFEITALTRPSSLEKPQNKALKERGIKVVAYDALGSQKELVEVLTGIEVLICAMGPPGFGHQIHLARAAMIAGVKRFAPSEYCDGNAAESSWDGNVPNALTDFSDVGRWVALIIADPMTLNKTVFAYNDVMTYNQVYDHVEKVSGEKLQRNYLSETGLATVKVQSGEAMAKDNMDPATVMKYYISQYFQPWAYVETTYPRLRSTWYLNGREIYPDFKGIPMENFFKDLLEGKQKSLV